VSDQKTAGAQLFTVGYEGKTLDGFLDLLTGSAVTVLVDVRELPVSRKPGFSKTRLQGILAEHGIDYISMRALGSPRDLRKELRDGGDYGTFFARYREHLDRQDVSLATLTGMVTGNAVCLMCYEADPERCHRSAIARELMNANGVSVEVQHL